MTHSPLLLLWPTLFQATASERLMACQSLPMIKQLAAPPCLSYCSESSISFMSTLAEK